MYPYPLKEICTCENFYVGAEIKLRPSVNLNKIGNVIIKKRKAEIVYINRKHRFFTAEFKFETGGSFRESFKYYTQDGYVVLIQSGVGEEDGK